MAMKGLRPLRLASFIQQEIATVLLTQSRNPLLQDIVITHVKVSDDLHEVKVYYRVMGDESLDLYKTTLGKATSFITRSIGPNLKMPFIPRFSFIYDTTVTDEERMESLLTNLKRDESDV